jgi:hypothetical protein
MPMRRTVLVAVLVTLATVSAVGAQETLPTYLQDRGIGVATSMFGTYVREGEWLFYPFLEYYRDQNLEYAPQELGAPGDQDYRGRYRATEVLFFVARGLTSNLAVEFEAAGIHASFEKSPQDASTLPVQLEESGFGDIEGQIRWRWKTENDRRPELFSYAEAVIPHSKDKVLIGTPDWEFNVGTGITRGFPWGTVTARAALEYAAASTSPFDLGEYGVEYLKRVSPKWRLYAGIEGSSDELSALGEAQWHVSPNVFIRLNNSFGLTSKAIDWAPEVGVVFSLRSR